MGRMMEKPLVKQNKNESLKSILKIKSHNDETENEKRVSFVDEKLSKNLHEVKPPTIIREDEICELDSLEREEIRIRECKTMQDIQIIHAQLIEEYAQIQDLKKNKIDVSQKFKNFNQKLDLIEQVKFEIEQKEILNDKIEKEKQAKINLNKKGSKNSKKKNFVEKETNSKQNNLEIIFRQENLFDEIIHKPIDLLILIEFDLTNRIKKVINLVKSFLENKNANKYRVAFSWQSSSQTKLTNFIDCKNQDLNFFNVDEDFYEKIDQLDWKKFSTRVFYRLFIWENNGNFFSSKFYEKNKNNFYMVKLDFSNSNFEFTVLNSFNVKSLQEIFDFFKLKQFFNDLFLLKRNQFPFVQDSNRVKLPSGKIRLNEIEDLNNSKALNNKINFKINENHLTLNGQQIFYGERVSCFDNFTQFFTKPKSEYWFEFFPNMKTIKQFSEIYETCGSYIDKFNESFGKNLIVLSEIKFLFDDSKRKTWFSNHVDLDIKSYKELNVFSVKDSVCQAFMHFTYVKSNESFIIFDLRPVFMKEKGYWLFTEPVILSTTDAGRFSSADLGLCGIEYIFLNKHYCNDYCNKFLQS